MLAPGATRPEHVEADSTDDHREPAAKVVAAGITPIEADPGLLDGVLGLGHGSQHPVGHGAQMRSLLLELVCQPVPSIQESDLDHVRAHLRLNRRTNPGPQL